MNGSPREDIASEPFLELSIKLASSISAPCTELHSPSQLPYSLPVSIYVSPGSSAAGTENASDQSELHIVTPADVTLGVFATGVVCVLGAAGHGVALALLTRGFKTAAIFDVLKALSASDFGLLIITLLIQVRLLMLQQFTTVCCSQISLEITMSPAFWVIILLM